MAEFFQWPFVALKPFNSTRKGLASLAKGDTGWIIGEDGAPRQGEPGRRWVTFRLDEEVTSGRPKEGKVEYDFGEDQTNSCIQRLQLPCVVLRDCVEGQNNMLKLSEGEEAFIKSTVGSFHCIIVAPSTLDGKDRVGYVRREDVRVGDVPKGRIAMRSSVSFGQIDLHSRLPGFKRKSIISEAISGLLLSLQAAMRTSSVLKCISEPASAFLLNNTAISNATSEILTGMSPPLQDIMSRKEFGFEDLWNCPEPSTKEWTIYCRLYRTDGVPSGIYIGQTVDWYRRQNQHAMNVRAKPGDKHYNITPHMRHARKATSTSCIKICSISTTSFLDVAEQVFMLLLGTYQPYLFVVEDPSGHVEGTEREILHTVPARELSDVARVFFKQVSWSPLTKRLRLQGLKVQGLNTASPFAGEAWRTIILYRSTAPDGTITFRRQPPLKALKRGTGDLGAYPLHPVLFVSIPPNEECGLKVGCYLNFVFELMPVSKGRNPWGYGRLPVVGGYSDWDECANLAIRVEWQHDGVWRAKYCFIGEKTSDAYWKCSKILAYLKQIKWANCSETRKWNPPRMVMRDLVGDHLSQTILINDVHEARTIPEPRLLPMNEIGVKLQSFGLRLGTKRDDAWHHFEEGKTRNKCDRCLLAKVLIHNQHPCTREGNTCEECKKIGVPCTWTKEIVTKGGYSKEAWRRGEPVPRILSPLMDASKNERIWKIGPVIFLDIPAIMIDQDHRDNNDVSVALRSSTLPARSQPDTASSSRVRYRDFPMEVSELYHDAQPAKDMLSEDGRIFTFRVFASLPPRSTSQSDNQRSEDLLKQWGVTHVHLDMIREPTADVKRAVESFDSMIKKALPPPHAPEHTKYPFDISSLQSDAQPSKRDLSEDKQTFWLKISTELPYRGTRNTEEWRSLLMQKQDETRQEFRMIRKPPTDVENGMREYDAMIWKELARLRRTCYTGSVYQIEEYRHCKIFWIRTDHFQHSDLISNDQKLENGKYFKLRIERELNVSMPESPLKEMQTYSRYMQRHRITILNIRQPTTELKQTADNYYAFASRRVRELYQKEFPMSTHDDRWVGFWYPSASLKHGSNYCPSKSNYRRQTPKGTEYRIDLPSRLPQWPADTILFDYLQSVAQEWREIRDALERHQSEKVGVRQYAKAYYDTVVATFDRIGGGAPAPSYQL